jgi:hypothetical protein
MPNTGWPRVKEILDQALERWKTENSRDPKMKGAHDGPIGWSTKEELLESRPYDLLLVEPEKVGNGRAEETNLIKILRRNIGGYRRMPSRGPYLSNSEIEELAQWIDAGLPD